MTEKLTVLPVLIPLLSAVVIRFLRFQRKKACNAFVFLAVLLNSLVILSLLIFPSSGTLTILRFGEEYSFALKADGAGRLFLGLTAFLWPTVTLYAFEYMEEEEQLPRFYSFYLMCFGITAGIALSANLLTMYFFYELLTLFAIPLIAHKGDRPSAAAAKKFALYAAAGAVFSLCGMLVFLRRAGCAEFTFGGAGCPPAGDAALLIAYLLLFIGFGVKAGIFPFHAWLPAACVSPAPADALLDAVAVMNCGVFACIRCSFYLFSPAVLAGTWAQQAALAITVVTILYGSAMALREQHLERRLAYSTISNISYILFGTALLTTNGLLAAFSHMLFHSIIKLTLFSCAGAILCKTGREYAPETTGLGRRMPLTFLTVMLAALALTGTPPLPGFISKANLLIAAGEADSFLAIAGITALLISALLTAAYLLPFSVRAFLTSREDMCVFTERDRDPGLLMLIPFAILSAAILALSFCSEPLMRLLQQIIAGT